MSHISKHESKYQSIYFYNFEKKLAAETILEKQKKGLKGKLLKTGWNDNYREKFFLIFNAIAVGTISRNLEKFRKSYYNIN